MEIKEYINEVWKPVRGYLGLYECSNFGRVRSLPRNGTVKSIKIIKPWLCNRYLQVTLSKDNNVKVFKVHRLVAETFIPNPNNYPIINHKDCNTLNNFVWVNPEGTVDLDKSNLEWCTHQYNNTYADRLEKASKACAKPVLQHTLNWEFIKKWDGGGAQIKRELGYSKSQISMCCHGKITDCYGYIWTFA